MSYNLQGDANSLDDIRRDIAALRTMETLVIAAESKLSPEQMAVYNSPVSLDDFYRFASQNGFRKQIATRLWRVLCGFDAAMGHYKTWYPNLVWLGVNGSSDTLYIGQLCRPALVHPVGRTAVLLEQMPNAGRACLAFLRQFVADKGCGKVELGSTPDDWLPPS